MRSPTWSLCHKRGLMFENLFINCFKKLSYVFSTLNLPLKFKLLSTNNKVPITDQNLFVVKTLINNWNYIFLIRMVVPVWYKTCKCCFLELFMAEILKRNTEEVCAKASKYSNDCNEAKSSWPWNHCMWVMG